MLDHVIRMLMWLRDGAVSPDAAHVGFVASSTAMVDAAYAAAMAAGATDNGAPERRVVERGRARSPRRC